MMSKKIVTTKHIRPSFCSTTPTLDLDLLINLISFLFIVFCFINIINLIFLFSMDLGVHSKFINNLWWMVVDMWPIIYEVVINQCLGDQLFKRQHIEFWIILFEITKLWQHPLSILIDNASILSIILDNVSIFIYFSIFVWNREKFMDTIRMSQS